MRSGARGLAGRFAWVAGGRIVAALIQALTLIVLIRSITPSNFGFISAVLGVVTLAQTLADLGVSTFIIRERAANEGNGIVTTALHLSNRLSAILAVSLAIILVSLAVFVDPRYWQLTPLAIWSAYERNADTWLGVAFADGDVWVNTLNLIARRLALLAGFFLLTLTDIPPMLSYAVVSAVCALGSSFFAHNFVRKRLVPGIVTKWAKIISYSWPYWLNSVATQARNLDVTIAAAVSGATQAGFYSASSRLTSPLRILPTSLASILLPYAAKKNSSNISRLALATIGMSIGMTVLYVGLALLCPIVVPVLLGDDYIDAIPSIQIACLGLGFAAAASLLGALLQGVGLRHFVAQASVAMTVACLVGVGIGAYFLGAVGGAIALALSFVIQSVLLFVRLAVFVLRKEPNR